MERTLLLVDDEANILSALTRLLRRDGYRILRAGSGSEGLEILSQDAVGVVISDQRMPEMTGTEFLTQVRKHYPDIVSIILSGYTDLNTITDAINQGAIYKFLTKPWEDDALRSNVEEAFLRHEMLAENTRLNRELREANQELARLNAILEERVQEKTREAGVSLHVLRVAQDILDQLPLAVVGVSEDDLIVVANRRASEWMGGGAPLLGEEASGRLPGVLLNTSVESESLPRDVVLDDGRSGRFWRYPLGDGAYVRGVVIVLEIPAEDKGGLSHANQ